MKKSVSLITINYNSIPDTVAFIRSIERTITTINVGVEVIVVDNASRVDPTFSLAPFPFVKLIRSTQNLGFAGGNNLGIRKSKGDYLFIVNNDTEVDLKNIELLIDQYEANPSYGILCPLIKYEDGRIQYAGYTEINKLTARNSLIDEVKDGAKQIVETSYPHGAAMLISRKNLERVGLMRENYFLYYEEIDWGITIRNHGLKVGVCLDSELIHKESATVGKVSQLKLYFMTRNRILYVRNHFSKMNRMIFTLFFSLVSVPKNMLLFLLRRDWASMRAFCEGIFWHFKNTRTSQRLGFKFDTLLK